MVGHASSPTRIVYVDMSLTGSKVKVIDLLKFQKSSRWSRLQPYDCDSRKATKQAVHAGDGDDRQTPCGAFYGRPM